MVGSNETHSSRQALHTITQHILGNTFLGSHKDISIAMFTVFQFVCWPENILHDKHKLLMEYLLLIKIRPNGEEK